MTNRAGPWEWGFRALCVAILIFLMLPTLIILPVSFNPTDNLVFPPRGFSLRWYRLFLTDPDWVAATLFSLRIAALTTLASSIIGTMGSMALAGLCNANAHVTCAGIMRAKRTIPLDGFV